jgi:RNA polymerase primary sigma factor
MIATKKLFRRKPLLVKGQKLALTKLDALLDVETPRFEAACRALAAAMVRARAELDVAGHRDKRAATANVTLSAPPRDPLYRADLARIPAMDRAEEFLMARRHEFVRELLRHGLRGSGFTADELKQLLQRPAAELLAAVAARPLARGVDRAWFGRVVVQFEELRNLFVEGALHIVLSTVHRYRGLGVDAADLTQEGNASLFQAIDGFDWRRDVRFRTYAQYWVHQAVLKSLYNSARTVRVPIWVQKVLGKIRRAQQAGRVEGRELTHQEIADRIGVTIDKVDWVLGTRRHAVSLDAEVGGIEGSSMAQLLPDDRLDPIPDSIPPGDLRAELDEALAELPAREGRILRRRFGLDGREPETLGEIATDLGITAERVRQLQNAALHRLKKPTRLRRLQAFVE